MLFQLCIRSLNGTLRLFHGMAIDDWLMIGVCWSVSLNIWFISRLCCSKHLVSGDLKRSSDIGHNRYTSSFISRFNKIQSHIFSYRIWRINIKMDLNAALFFRSRAFASHGKFSLSGIPKSRPLSTNSKFHFQ